MKIDLVLLTNGIATQCNWQYGKVMQVAASVDGIGKAIEQVTQDESSDWILVWDAAFVMPDKTLLETLTAKPIDVWHSGLKTGNAGLPQVMNYVDPTWMYNKNAPVDVEHTNFRLSFRCLLIKRNILKGLREVINGFLSVEMAGIAIGYALIKSGAIIRYTPLLLEGRVTSGSIPLTDEWIFAKKFYTRKWHWWILVTMPRFAANIMSALKTTDVKRQNIKPRVHRSDKKLQATYETVSVLAPTLDRYEYLQAELEQLAHQNILPAEVLITDQTPIVRRKAIDASWFPPLIIRYFPQDSSGQCIAWNKLLEEATGEYVLFLGDDADDITPDFIEKLLATMQAFGADMVAANVVEAGIAPKQVNPYYYISDTFPITLIKRKLLLETGFMDMFYNRNIRADHDLAMRCHLLGALMIFNPSATIFHHRAPVGGLRAHKARVVTNHMVKQSLSRFTVPTSSELYLVKKFYSKQQFKAYVRMKFLNQLFVTGGIVRKLLKTMLFIVKMPVLIKKYNQHLAIANAAINESTSGNR